MDTRTLQGIERRKTLPPRGGRKRRVPFACTARRISCKTGEVCCRPFAWQRNWRKGVDDNGRRPIQPVAADDSCKGSFPTATPASGRLGDAEQRRFGCSRARRTAFARRPDKGSGPVGSVMTEWAGRRGTSHWSSPGLLPRLIRFRGGFRSDDRKLKDRRFEGHCRYGVRADLSPA